VFIKLYGVPAEHYGWLFGSNAAGFILVAQLNARLLAKRGPAFLLSRTVWVYVAAALALLGIAALRTEALWPLLVPLFICIASLGCILPNTSACAMNGQGARAGSASALLGCGGGGIAGGRVARRHGDADGDGHQPVRCAGGDDCDVDPAPATGQGRAGAGLI
jgi:DHA1 family bicyclomycin/chloramphenicol resistance-like MFS transporter